jgi:Acetyltransferase (GNAT) domain
VQSIEHYRPELRDEWNAFVRSSRNGTFLFERGYMDYHGDRFKDFSLVVRDNKGRVKAMLPANREEDRVVSHGGLTYGGFIIDSSTGTASMLDVFSHATEFLSASGIREFIYKPVPHIYHLEPCEEDLYALFRMEAQLIQRDVGACACPAEIEQPSKRLRWLIRRAEDAGIVVEESERFEDFWPILEDNLAARHQVAPAHSLSEIRLLKSRFPANIRLFLAKRGESVLAGSVVYETVNVAHCQYAGATEEGRALGAQRLVVTELLRTRFRDKKWFDYGISTAEEALTLNTGLQDFKERLGLRAVVSDRYRMTLWE